MDPVGRAVFFTTLTHSFGLLGMPSKDRISKADQSFVLLSPHYEIMYGSWFFQYQASRSGCASRCSRPELWQSP